MVFNWRKRAIFAMAAGGLITGLIAGPAGAAHAATAGAAAKAGQPLCGAQVLFVGARGSGEDGPGTPGWEGTEADPVGLGPEVNSVFNRMTATDFADVPIYWGTQPISVDYQANRVQTLVRAPNLWFANLDTGVDNALGILVDWAQKCPNQKIVLVGYSQGAMVMHRVLHDLINSNDSTYKQIRARIVATILIADGDQVPRDNEVDYGTAGVAADGIGHRYTNISETSSAKFPKALTSQVLRVCNHHDPVCDSTWDDLNPLTINIHTHYAGTAALYAATDRAAGYIIKLAQAYCTANPDIQGC